MTKYPTTPLSIVNLVITTFKAYPTLLPQVWLLVLLSALVHFIVPPLFMVNPTWGGVAFIGFILFTWFLYIAIIAIAHVALQGGHLALPSAFRIARHRYLWVLGSNIIFFAIGALFFVVEYGLNLVLNIIDQHPLFVLIVVAINLFIFVLLYFAIPLLALEHTRILKAFEHSARLVKNNWWRTFIVLAVIGLFILGFEALGVLFTGQNRMVLLTVIHFLNQLIFYPLIISATLILLNDLKLRHSQKELKTG